MNLCVAGLVLYCSSAPAGRRTGGARSPERSSIGARGVARGVVGEAVALVLVAGYANLGSLHQYFLKRYYYYVERPDSLQYLFSPMSDMPEVFRASSRYQKIDIVHDPRDEILIDAYSTKYVEDPSQPRDRFLFLNGDLQVVSNYEEVYHEFFAHVPVLLHGEMPERVLVMGAGDGLLIRELLKYTELETIRHVDLDPVLIELAKTHPTLTAMNGHALEDPRVRTTIGDAFQFIRTDPERYDAIYLDFPYVMDYNLSKLYSREFFHFVRAHLRDGGYAVLDAPASEFFVRDSSGATVMASDSDWPVYYETLKGAGFETVVPFVSAVELDNPAAHQALSPLIQRQGLTGDAARARSLAYLGAHANGLMQGFILARRGPGREPRYRDLGITLHVLNETRFHLAFAQPHPMRDGVDDDTVNSIMRPTMPTVPWWYTRAAW